MTRSGTLLLAAALVSAAPVAARDPRLVQHLYNADEVVRIDGRLGVEASVVFGQDEHIENVAVGDAQNWQITPNKRANLLFIKPVSANARTNMTVVTDRHTYFFDLVASPRAAPIYALAFTYPAGEPKPASASSAGGGALNEAERAALNPDEAPVDPSQLNFAWRMSGSGKLLPQRLYDDGAAVYVAWAPGVPLPAILVANEKGDEGPVNFAVRGQTIVIDGVPQRIILRAGRDHAELDYKGPGPRPRDVRPPSGPIQAGQASAPAVAAVPATKSRSE